MAGTETSSLRLRNDEAPERVSTSARRARQRHVARLKTTLTSVGAIVLVVALWEAVIRLFDVPLYLVPAPSDVWVSITADSATLLANLWPTTLESVLGFIVGNAAAILLAIVFVHSKRLEDALFPLAIILRTIPIVAIAPVLVLMLGNGYAPKIVIAALISFFPTLVNMVRGFKSVDPQMFELMRVLSASKREIFFQVRVYSSLPYLFAALKIAAPAAVIGAIVAEWIGSKVGLGALIIEATYNFDTPLLYATMLLGSLLSIAFFVVIGFLEKMTIRWEADSPP